MAQEAVRAGALGDRSMSLAGSLSGGRRVIPPRIFLANPCSLISTGRLEDVAATLRADVILFLGTNQNPWGIWRTPFCAVAGIAQVRVALWWSRGACTNRSAGCSIILGRRLATKELVRAERSFPSKPAECFRVIRYNKFSKFQNENLREGRGPGWGGPGGAVRVGGEERGEGWWGVWVCGCVARGKGREEGVEEWLVVMVVPRWEKVQGGRPKFSRFFLLPTLVCFLFTYLVTCSGMCAVCDRFQFEKLVETHKCGVLCISCEAPAAQEALGVSHDVQGLTFELPWSQ